MEKCMVLSENTKKNSNGYTNRYTKPIPRQTSKAEKASPDYRLPIRGPVFLKKLLKK